MSELYPSSLEDTAIHEVLPLKCKYSYQDIHNLITLGAKKLDKINFDPDYIIAIGGGGFIPARILRSYVDVPILALTLNFYNGESHTPTSEPNIIQTFDINIIKGKNVLIVDEVDDTRTTLKWVLDYISDNATIGIFVVHNKKKTKVIEFDDNLHYIACEETDGNTWIDYPWDYI